MSKTLSQEIGAAVDQTRKELTRVDIVSEEKEEKLMEEIGFNHWINTNKKQRSELSLVKKFGELIRFEDIKDVAVRYNMVMVRPKYYLGAPGPETAQKIHDFGNTVKGYSREEFFILSPVELVSKPKVDPPVRVARLEPVLFYRVTNGALNRDHMFRLIDQWGGDFTWTRRLKTILLKWMGTIVFFIVMPLIGYELTHNVPFFSIPTLLVWVVACITKAVIRGHEESAKMNLGNLVDGETFDGHYDRTDKVPA